MLQFQCINEKTTHLVNDGLGGVHAVVVSVEEGLVLGLGALIGAGGGLVVIAGLSDEAAAVVAEVEDALCRDAGVGSRVGEGEGRGEKEGDEKCEVRLHLLLQNDLGKKSQVKELI